MKNARIKFILFWIFLIVSFCFFAVILILEAYGYRLNRQNYRLELTGTIVLDGQPKDMDLKVNGQEPIDNTLPIKISKLLPGQYEVIATKENYQTWSKLFRLHGGEAVELKKIFLFFNEPKILESNRKITVEELQADFKSQGQALKIIENEIWYQEKLVTRFLQKPSGAILTNDRYHIIAQVGSEIRAMDIDGTNNLKLAALPNESLVSFALYNNDKLVWASEGKFWEAEIR